MTTYDGAANRATWDFNLHWQNDYDLYHAVLTHARGLLLLVPTMTDEALGRNVKDRVHAWAVGGGCYGFYYGDTRFMRVLSTLDVGNYGEVDDREVGEHVREALAIE